ncbi:MAG: selenide, water dikinase SelD [Pirellulaceae bacterium]|nr:selenide, water dikinase SelD [Planctomycetales bacterium]
MQQSLPNTEIVLLGVGHTNAHIVKMWRMGPIARARLTCISTTSIVTYSGMLPGVLAGQYPESQMQIDLVRLCASVGARLILGNVTGIDVEKKHVLMEDRPPLPFDLLSIGIGSVPAVDDTNVATGAVVAIKPMQTFLTRLRERLRGVADRGAPELQVVVVGGGVGGVEIACCLPRFIERELPRVLPRVTIVHSDMRLAKGMSDEAIGLLQAELARRNTVLRLGRRVVAVDGRQVILDDGAQLNADLVLWATGASPPDLIEKIPLPKDEHGFLLTSSTLQTVGCPNIFAVGDCGAIRDEPLPKAGVYAVREGPVLWSNLLRMTRSWQLKEFRPQRDFLKILNLGNGQAIAEYWGRARRGRWCWWLKDWIDRRFMSMYQDYRPMPVPMVPIGQSPVQQVRCVGCGGKVSGTVLSRVLRRLRPASNENVVVGLTTPDDAAVLQVPDPGRVAITVDFFASPFDDPYLTGRIAAINSLSDLIAMRARPIAALANVTLPVGSERRQEEELCQLLSGGLRHLDAAGAALVGGHTIEGPRLTAGFTAIGSPAGGGLFTKGRLRPGDRLVLTKPIGTGILLAAQMQAALQAGWYEALLEAMLDDPRELINAIEKYDIQGLTDVTGFGLAGHLLEMLKAAEAAAVVKLQSIPLLPGVAELIAADIQSTLAPANRHVETNIMIEGERRQLPEYAALFDPQTCGGFVLAVPADRVAGLLAEFASHRRFPLVEIGQVVPAEQLPTAIQLI